MQLMSSTITHAFDVFRVAHSLSHLVHCTPSNSNSPLVSFNLFDSFDHPIWFVSSDQWTCLCPVWCPSLSNSLASSVWFVRFAWHLYLQLTQLSISIRPIKLVWFIHLSTISLPLLINWCRNFILSPICCKESVWLGLVIFLTVPFFGWVESHPTWSNN